MLAATVAHSESSLKIGEAEIIRNDVVSVEGDKLIPVVVGDVIIRDEVIQTAANSDARIELMDKTKLTLGPNSSLKIDRAVSGDESRTKQITILLTEGTFR